jgi:putative ATP-binding cassette transporter
LRAPRVDDAKGRSWPLTEPCSAAGLSSADRAAGVWPWGSGDIDVRAGAKLLALPQQSYLPMGTDEMEIADKPCALVAAQENDFAIMKVRQFCAMTDADNRRVFELLQ